MNCFHFQFLNVRYFQYLTSNPYSQSSTGGWGDIVSQKLVSRHLVLTVARNKMSCQNQGFWRSYCHIDITLALARKKQLFSKQALMVYVLLLARRLHYRMLQVKVEFTSDMKHNRQELNYG
jgi:hypothetical protein